MAKSFIAVPFLVVCLLATNLFVAGNANAQSPAGQDQPAASGTETTATPGGAGTKWQTEVTAGTPEKAAGLSAEDIDFVRQVSGYFNRITDLQGTFVQTSSANEHTKGKFFVKRPGRLRFDYSAPSRMRIVSDGEWLTIEDADDPSNVQRFSLSSTPFRMLLRKDVDLMRDSNILDISRGEDIVILTVIDKNDDSSGRIKLFFAVPNLELKEWIITDPQGLDTRVQIANLEWDKTIDPEFFKPSEFKIPDFQN